MYPVSQEDAGRFEDFYNSIEKFNDSDHEMLKIIYESCDPYFAGDKNLDETVSLIQNRVGLYVGEQM